MKLTFGIITNGTNNIFIEKIYQSIINQNIDDKFEIIIVGGNDLELPHTRHIYFNENIKNSWITRKKNLIAENSKYDNLIILHDYVYFHDSWYKYFIEFTNDWDVCMNSIINYDGERFRDWITWPEWCQENDIIFLDYDDDSRTSQMYVSGTYFCVKKEFLINNPFNENLCWGQGEDVEWSNRIKYIWNYKCNSKCKVGLLKYKYNEHWMKQSNLRAREKWMRLS